MQKKTIPCICGKNAEIRRLPVFGVFMIKCECGKRTGADTEASARRFWDKLNGKEQKDEPRENVGIR